MCTLKSHKFISIVWMGKTGINPEFSIFEPVLLNAVAYETYIFLFERILVKLTFAGPVARSGANGNTTLQCG